LGQFDRIDVAEVPEPAILLRPAVRTDVPAIVSLLADDAIGATREGPLSPLPASYLAAFDEIEESPVHELVVAAVDRRVVGVLQLSFLRYLTYRGGVRAQIEGVRVAQDARGAGIGGMLFRWAIARAEECGAHLVQLTTDLRRPDAKRFYQQLGFEVTHHGMKLHLPGQPTGAGDGADVPVDHDASEPA